LGRTTDLLRNERRARAFFAVIAQSALGNGAAYVALLVIAYDRFQSGWAIGLILLADLVPAMLFGPVFGAAADRWSRRGCLIVADVLRAGAFLGIAFVDSFVATFALAIVAGVGTGLFTPASLASIPSLVQPARLPAATALYGALADIGFVAGPAIAAGALALGGPEAILFGNAATFAISGIALTQIRFGAAPPQAEGEVVHPGLFRDAREGVRAVVAMAGIRAVVAASGAMLLFAGLFNVAELPFAKEDLGAGDVGFGVLTAIYGLGFVAGSLSGSKGGSPKELKRRFLVGLAVVAVGFIACGLAPGFAPAAPAFALAGIGNGLVLVYERLLIQTTVPDRLMARVFGVKDGLTAWAFAAAFIAAGGLVDALGARALIVIAGAGGLIVWAGGHTALRRAWIEPAETGATVRGTGLGLLARRGGALGDRPAREDGTDIVGGPGDRSSTLDDRDQRGDDIGVELGPRVGE
jgi:MFS family permease